MIYVKMVRANVVIVALDWPPFRSAPLKSTAVNVQGALQFCSILTNRQGLYAYCYGMDGK